MNLERGDSVREIEKLNAIATMTIRAYQKKNRRLKIALCGLLLLYILTTLVVLSYLHGSANREETTFAVASPLCILVCRAVAKHEKTGIA